MKTWKKRSLIGVAVAFAAIQLVPCARVNPPEKAPLEASPEVRAVLARACFDCHSNVSRWPWYSHVAPVSWLVVHDVEEGRRELNFSNWGAMPEIARVEKRHEVAEEVTEGEMPPGIYTPLHPDAKLSPEDVAILLAWSREGDPSQAATPGDDGDRKRRRGRGDD